MKTNAVIRPARPADATALAALMRQTFLAASGHCSTPDNVARFLETAYQPSLQAAEIRDPDTLTVVVEQDGQWAGFAQLRWGTRPPPEIELLPTVELGRIHLDPAFHVAASLRNWWPTCWPRPACGVRGRCG